MMIVTGKLAFSGRARMNERVCVLYVLSESSATRATTHSQLPEEVVVVVVVEGRRPNWQRYVCVCLNTRKSCFKRFLPGTPNHCQNQIVKQSCREMTRLSLLTKKNLYIFKINARKENSQPKTWNYFRFQLIFGSKFTF